MSSSSGQLYPYSTYYPFQTLATATSLLATLLSYYLIGFYRCFLSLDRDLLLDQSESSLIQANLARRCLLAWSFLSSDQLMHWRKRLQHKQINQKTSLFLLFSSYLLISFAQFIFQMQLSKVFKSNLFTFRNQLKPFSLFSPLCSPSTFLPLFSHSLSSNKDSSSEFWFIFTSLSYRRFVQLKSLWKVIDSAPYVLKSYCNFQNCSLFSTLFPSPFSLVYRASNYQTVCFGCVNVCSVLTPTVFLFLNLESSASQFSNLIFKALRSSLSLYILPMSRDRMPLISFLLPQTQLTSAIISSILFSLSPISLITLQVSAAGGWNLTLFYRNDSLSLLLRRQLCESQRVWVLVWGLDGKERYDSFEACFYISIVLIIDQQKYIYVFKIYLDHVIPHYFSCFLLELEQMYF